ELSNGHSDAEIFAEASAADGYSTDGLEIVSETGDDEPEGPDDPASDAAAEMRLEKEIESIRFYIDSGYGEMAEKALAELRSEFGHHIEIEKLEAELMLLTSGVADVEPSGSVIDEPVTEIDAADIPDAREVFDIDEFRSEFGLDETEAEDGGDYETLYNTAVAYSEMGLTEQAIKEFQEAIAIVSPNDGTRRFFQCATLLGHCFIQQGMAKLALTWFERALESADLNSDEKQGVWYEIAHAYEIDGDTENAARYFEQIYAENVNFRDVSERVKSLTVA